MEAALRRSKPAQEARASLVVQVCEVGVRLSDKILRRLGEVATAKARCEPASIRNTARQFWLPRRASIGTVGTRAFDRV